MSLNRVLLPGLVLAGGLSTPLLALEGPTHGVRLTVDIMPVSYETSGDMDENGSFDSTGRLKVTYNYVSNHEVTLAWSVGAGLAATSFAEEDNDVTTTIGEFGLVVEPALNINIKPWFTIEVAALLGVGTAAGKTEDDNTNTDVDHEGWYWEAGLTVRPVFNFDFGLVLFAELGYYYQVASMEIDDAGMKADYDLTIQGAYGGIGAGWQF